MRIAIIDCGTNRIPELSEITWNYWAEYTVYDMSDVRAGNCGAEKLSEYTGIIISWGPKIIDDSNRSEYLEYFSFLKDINTPIFAICFWHQLIGHVYGCEYEIKNQVVGTYPVNFIDQKNPIFQNLEANTFRMNHTQHISIPQDFILTANSDTCLNEWMRHRTKNIFTTQFHPEASWEHGRKLIENFLEMCN